MQKLYIARFSAHGAYLRAKEAQILSSHLSYTHATEVLLPKKFLTPTHAINDEVEAFILTDSSDRLVATTQTPKAQYGDIAQLEVVGYAPFGCFLDLGLDKHIFMPSKTPHKFSLKQKVCVFITLDKQGRLIAKQGIKSYLKSARPALYAPHTLTKAFVFEQTPLGFGCAIDNAYYGLIYKNELPKSAENLTLGASINAYIKAVRKDGKIDLTLYPPSSHNQKAILLESMPLYLNFSSSPQAIFDAFKMSKKLFKRLINELVREGKIEFVAHRQTFELCTH
ncbi:hypothetical protein LS71_001735 [Helicobacter jaachi]|uniref:DNA-binding protein n=1 Tax=Helicobacter jaachi TaxID=1677920 RepID=A0A4U8TD02_9HELI|nr:hypothetical protein LS71_001735 [Helicobacter jaachi]